MSYANLYRDFGASVMDGSGCSSSALLDKQFEMLAYGQFADFARIQHPIRSTEPELSLLLRGCIRLMHGALAQPSGLPPNIEYFQLPVRH
jgi:hypothetical protein